MIIDIILAIAGLLLTAVGYSAVEDLEKYDSHLYNFNTMRFFLRCVMFTGLTLLGILIIRTNPFS